MFGLLTVFFASCVGYGLWLEWGNLVDFGMVYFYIIFFIKIISFFVGYGKLNKAESGCEDAANYINDIKSGGFYVAISASLVATCTALFILSGHEIFSAFYFLQGLVMLKLNLDIRKFKQKPRT